MQWVTTFKLYYYLDNNCVNLTVRETALDLFPKQPKPGINITNVI